MFGFIFAIAFSLSALCFAAQEDPYTHDRDLVLTQYVSRLVNDEEDEEERTALWKSWHEWLESRREKPCEISQRLIVLSYKAKSEEEKVLLLSLARQCKALIDDAEIDLHVDDASSVEAGS